ncbi:MAG TPA: acetate--CoA ligase family protein [Candidatus Limnocylindrales bacterium]|nr:acetate--CoA ligase family protein [Candidatus Limnocylindrales bacterium]
MAVASSPETPPLRGTTTPPTSCPDVRRIAAILRRARRARAGALLEPEGLALLDALGIDVPRHVVLGPRPDVTAEQLATLRGDRVVVKVVAAGIAHKSDVGGVAVAENTVADVVAAIAQMRFELGPVPIVGFLVEEYVDHEAGVGGELLLSIRWTADFGPVIGVGIGGIHAEVLARDLQPGRELAVVAPGLTPAAELASALRSGTAVRLATEPQRGRPAVLPIESLVEVVERLAALARCCGPGGILDLEINPLALTPDGAVALDVLVTMHRGPGVAPSRIRQRPERPVWKLARLLEPASIAIAGVSGGENPGRTILRNLIRDGFDPARIVIVKPGVETLDGCRCVPDIGALPGKVDLFVVAVAAARAAAMVAEVAARDAAESIIVIPGGFEEKAGGDLLAGRMRAALDASRRRPGGGPLVNGGNCLGIRSRPGHYDTFFIPEAKLAPPSGHPVPLAIVSQSGAFALSRMSRLHGLDPKYVISVGNQMDLTIGDHLRHLANDPEIRVVGVYVEGFAPLDGRAFLEAARAIRARGGTVVLYRAGRTAAGASASASHTAAIAGDALLTEALARGAGVVAAGTLEAFDDLLRTFVLLDGRTVGGRRLGAVSNAGFECVAIADNLGVLEPASFDAATRDRLAGILDGAGLADVVDVHDPFDLTPMGDDATFAAVAEAILADEGVDVGLVGDVPFTAALRTLPRDAETGIGEDLGAAGAIAPRLVDLWHQTSKAWVTVVDAGPRYDPLARTLEAGGIPTFRTADAALRALGAVVERAAVGGG